MVASSGVTVVQTTPTVWRLLIGHGLAPRPTLRAWCGGEQMPADLTKHLTEVCGEAWNVYGPTETTVWCSAWRVVAGGDVSIGEPLDNVTFHVLGPGCQQQPVGAAGELHIGGAGVTPGYIGRPDQTAAAYIPNPFGPGALYRTGDLVVRAEDGQLHFLGRVDHQIKLHGLRIEPGEIEAAIVAKRSVGAAAVVVRDEQLIAFVESDAEIDPADLRHELASELPVSMVPARIELIDRLPLTTSRKIDRKALQGVPLTPIEVLDEPPRPGVEQELARLVAQEVGRDRVGRHDDFFHLGGDSLGAAALFAEIHAMTGREYPLAALFEGPTVAALAEIIGSEWRQSATSLVAVHRRGPQRPFFSVSPFLISALSYRLLADQLGPEQPLYALQPQGLESDDPIHQRVEDMAAHCIDELRVVQATGPYRIGGHCAGNWVAFEMALQLQQAGEEVEALILVDGGPPGVERSRSGRLAAWSAAFATTEPRVDSDRRWLGNSAWRASASSAGGRADPLIDVSRRSARAHSSAVRSIPARWPFRRRRRAAPQP